MRGRQLRRRRSAEPFDGASLEKLAGQCVTLETELGAIEIAIDAGELRRSQ